MSEISDPKNDHNLNLPRYIDSAEPEDLHDIQDQAQVERLFPIIVAQDY